MNSTFRSFFAQYLNAYVLDPTLEQRTRLSSFITYLTDDEASPNSFGLVEHRRQLFKPGPRADLFWQHITDAFIALTELLDMQPGQIYSLRRLLMLLTIAQRYSIGAQYEAGKNSPVETALPWAAIWEANFRDPIPAMEDVLAERDYVIELLNTIENPPAPMSLAQRLQGRAPAFNVTPEEMDAAAKKLQEQTLGHTWDSLDEISLSDFNALILMKTTLTDTQPVLKDLTQRYAKAHPVFDRFWNEVVSRFHVLLSPTPGYGGTREFPEPLYFGQFVEVLQEAMRQTELLWVTLRRERPMAATWEHNTSFHIQPARSLATRLFDLESLYGMQTHKAPRLYGEQYQAPKPLSQPPAPAAEPKMHQGLPEQAPAPSDAGKGKKIIDLLDASFDAGATSPKSFLAEHRPPAGFQSRWQIAAEEMNNRLANVQMLKAELLKAEVVRSLQVFFYEAKDVHDKIVEVAAKRDGTNEDLYVDMDSELLEVILTTSKHPGSAALKVAMAHSVVDCVNRLKFDGDVVEYEVEICAGSYQGSFFSKGLLRDALVELFDDSAKQQWHLAEDTSMEYTRVGFHMGEHIEAMQLLLYRELP